MLAEGQVKLLGLKAEAEELLLLLLVAVAGPRLLQLVKQLREELIKAIALKLATDLIQSLLQCLDLLIKDKREELADLLKVLLVLPRTDQLCLMKGPDSIAACCYCCYCQVLSKRSNHVKRLLSKLLQLLGCCQLRGCLVCLDLVSSSSIVV